MEKLKLRWGIESNFQVIVIFIVFAVNGSLAVSLAKPTLNFIGITPEFTNPIIFWTVKIILMLIVYQVLLVVVGTLFGQHKFFWSMEKKIIKRLGLGSFLNEKK